MKGLRYAVLPMMMAAVLVLAGCGAGDDEPAPGEEGSPSQTEGAQAPASPDKPSSPAKGSAQPRSIVLFSPDSPFNQRIGSGPAIDPNSDLMTATLVADARQGFVISVKDFSAPVYVVDTDTPRHAVTIRCGEEWGMGVSAMKNVPIPDGAEPAEAGGTENPDNCGGGEDAGDYHLIVIDPATRCEYDFWQAKRTAGGWSASWGNAISIDGDGIFPKGMSARGSGFAFTAGMIWPGELESGRIDHALAFNYSAVKAGGPVAPATESDGEVTRRGAIPEGARVQLDPGLNLDTLGLSDYEQTIARALQEYGMFLVDSGGAEGGLSLYAVDPKSWGNNPYQNIWPDEEYISVGNIPADRFRVLQLPPQVPDPELAVVPNACTVWE